MRAPVLGGNFGVWGGLFSTFDCAVKGVRKKEDPFNAIAAGFLTGGSLAIRGGFRAARNGAIGCAVLLAVIEGVGIGFQKMFAGATKLEVSRPPSSPISPADHSISRMHLSCANMSLPTAGTTRSAKREGPGMSGHRIDGRTTHDHGRRPGAVERLVRATRSFPQLPCTQRVISPQSLSMYQYQKSWAMISKISPTASAIQHHFNATHLSHSCALLLSYTCVVVG